MVKMYSPAMAGKISGQAGGTRAKKGRPSGGALTACGKRQLRCLLTILVMSNMETWLFPPKTGRSLSSALMARRFLASCSPFRLMYCQSFLVTSVRGIGVEPTTAESCALGCIGFMNAALGTRFLPVDF